MAGAERDFSGHLQDFRGGADALQFSGNQNHEAGGHAARLLGVVRDEDAREIVFDHDAGDEPFHVVLGIGVEGAGGFVEEEDVGTIGEGAGDTDALGFATGEAAGIAVGVAGEADVVEELVDLLRGELLVALARAEGDVVGDGAGEEKGGLQDHSDAAAKFARGEGFGVGVVEKDRAGRGLVETVEESKE